MNQTTNQKWSQVYSQGRDFQLISSTEIDSFLTYAQGAKSCLDIGCGTGQLTRELYHRGLEVVGVDASEEAIKRAIKLAIGLDAPVYIYGDIEAHYENLKLRKHNFDLITCKLVYAFISDKPAFLQKISELLSPTGVFVVITPMIEDVPPEKASIAINDETIELLEAHFVKLATYKLNNLTYFVCKNK
jgi:2-polyprenyl-3-methyl-5-hydroxy-6-metoxy-1,4-benzoquinol methylase